MSNLPIDNPGSNDRTGDGLAGGATEFATFGAGCFWGVEDEFRKIDGVVDVTVGYEGGHVDHPTYEMVCAKGTGHAEVVRVEFDPAKVEYRDLLELFWRIHDPTQLNRQGPDIGDQYRSVIFTHSDEQARVAADSLADAQTRESRPIVTVIEPSTTFWPAEDYHQQFLEKRRRKYGFDIPSIC